MDTISVTESVRYLEVSSMKLYSYSQLEFKMSKIGKRFEILLKTQILKDSKFITNSYNIFN